MNRWLVLLTTTGLVLSIPWPGEVGVAQPQAGNYRPVAPPAALHTGLLSQLNLVQYWLDDGDFQSAAQAMRGLLTLAEVNRYQNGAADWQQRNAKFIETGQKLFQAIGSKNQARCKTAMAGCRAELKKMAVASANGKAMSVKNFKAPGATKIWMLLMDGSYVDAKAAATPKELEQLAYVIAEEVNVAGYLRTSPDWKRKADLTRAAALEVVKTVRTKGMPAGKLALKNVFRRCEDCHQRNKK